MKKPFLLALLEALDKERRGHICSAGGGDEISAADNLTFMYKFDFGAENVYLSITARNNRTAEERPAAYFVIKNHTGKIDSVVIQILQDVDRVIYQVQKTL